jgi:hypothetical protein
MAATSAAMTGEFGETPGFYHKRRFKLGVTATCERPDTPFVATGLCPGGPDVKGSALLSGMAGTSAAMTGEEWRWCRRHPDTHFVATGLVPVAPMTRAMRP